MIKRKVSSNDLFIPQVAGNVLVVSGVAGEFSLEKGHIDQRGVEVDELEDEHFEREVVVKL